MDHYTNPIMIGPLPEPCHLEATTCPVIDAGHNPKKYILRPSPG
jgi:hypothetical protein